MLSRNHKDKVHLKLCSRNSSAYDFITISLSGVKIYFFSRTNQRLVTSLQKNNYLQRHQQLLPCSK